MNWWLIGYTLIGILTSLVIFWKWWNDPSGYDAGVTLGTMFVASSLWPAVWICGAFSLLAEKLNHLHRKKHET